MQEEIEVLCKLFRTVGARLEADTGKKQRDNMTKFFTRLTELTVDKTLSSRSRFGVLEIIELRKNDWVERQVKTVELKAP